MSVPSRAPVRRRLLVVIASAAALVGGLVLAPSAGAAPKPPPASITSVTFGGTADIPSGDRSPKVLIVAGSSVTVTVTFDRAPSTTKDTVVTVYRDSFPAQSGALAVAGTATVLAGQTSGTTGAFTVDEQNRFVARAVVTDGTKDALAIKPASSGPVDVVDPANLTNKVAATGRVSIGGNGDDGTKCLIDTAHPYCADVIFPGTNGQVRLAFTDCDSFLGCGTTPGSDRQVLQVLFDTTGINALNPVTVIYRCDKTKCGNIGVPQVDMLVGTGDLTQSLQSLDTCRKAGEQTSRSGYCFDTKQSTKDNAGDVYLYVLMTQDPRLSWP